MGSKLFNSLKAGQNSSPNLMSQLQLLMRNPVQFLMERNLRIPPNIANNPEAIAQHLLNTGQMSEDQMHMIQDKIRQVMPM